MRNLGTCLLAILLFAGPAIVGLGVGIWLHASQGLSSKMVVPIVAGVILGGYGLLVAGSFVKRKAEQRVLFVVDDEALGHIQVRRNDWEATQFVATLNREIKIDAERGEQVPTPEQAALWVEIVNRLDDLLTKARHALQADAENSVGKDCEFQTTELELTEVSLDADGGFSFGLEVPRLKERLPDGFYALFTNFEVVEACYVH